MDTILKILNDYPKELAPIKEQAEKYLDNNPRLDEENTIGVIHRPWVARMNWAIILFKGINQNWIPKFEEMTDKNIPDFYRDLLLSLNGCFIYDVNLFGCSKSIFEQGLVDRSILQPLDLSRANISWLHDYRIDPSFFYFGSRRFSKNENLGYFVDGNNQIFTMLKNGTVIKTYDNFNLFLGEEIGLAEERMLQDLPSDISLKLN